MNLVHLVRYLSKLTYQFVQQYIENSKTNPECVEVDKPLKEVWEHYCEVE